MNCKPGDLAIVARLTNEDLLPHMGKIVMCVKRRDDFDSWFTVPELAPGKSVYDGALRPIRPGEGEDETLSWAGKPEQVTA